MLPAIDRRFRRASVVACAMALHALFRRRDAGRRSGMIHQPPRPRLRNACCWTTAFNGKDLEAVCGLFAPDLELHRRWRSERFARAVVRQSPRGVGQELA